MSGNKEPAISFNDFIQEGRKKRQAEELAQSLLGKNNKNRRSSAPPTGPKAGNLAGSLASRMGVNKRNSSLPRTNTPRNAPRPVAPLSRIRSDLAVERPSRPSSTRPEVGSRSNSGIINGGGGAGGGGLSIRGAATSTASAPPVIVAQNFAPGTTAADIESVMVKVGGELTNCRLIASTPTVIAEMTFADPAGAEEVIEQFNGKKADGRTLYVYRRDDGGARRPTVAPVAATAPAPDLMPLTTSDDAMMVDEAASAREANNRMREERRGRDDRDVFPSGPRGYREDYYDRGPRGGGAYADGRYGYGGGGGAGGYAARGGQGRYDGRERNFGGGRSWRP